jgi:hypothetical protein
MPTLEKITFEQLSQLPHLRVIVLGGSVGVRLRGKAYIVIRNMASIPTILCFAMLILDLDDGYYPFDEVCQSMSNDNETLINSSRRQLDWELLACLLC